MSITHVNTQSDSGTANTGTTTVTKPTGLQVGDVLLAFICMNDDAAATGPSGWTKYDDDVDTTNHFRSQVWYKVATSTETAASNFSWTTTAGATSPMWGAVSAYRGVDTSGVPIHAAANSSFTTSTNPVTGPSISTTVTSTIVHYRQVRISGSTTIPTYTGSGNRRFQAGNHGASTSYSGASFDSGSDTAAGSVSGISITCSSTPSTALSRTIALKTLIVDVSANAGVAAVTASGKSPALDLASFPDAGTASTTATGQPAVGQTAKMISAGAAAVIVSVPQVTVATTPFNNAPAGLATVTVAGKQTRMNYASAGGVAVTVSGKKPFTSIGNQADTAQVLSVASDPSVGVGINAGVAHAAASGVLAGPGLGTLTDIATSVMATAYGCGLYFGSTRTIIVAAEDRTMVPPYEDRTLMVEES